MAGMGKKHQLFAGKRLAFALDTLSKAAALDILTDLAQREAGEDASDEVLAKTIADFGSAVSRMRGDKSYSHAFATALKRWDRAVEQHKRLGNLEL
jgi:hypothetical protein